MAVYTELSDREVAAFLAHYDLPEPIDRAPLEGGVSNSNWRLDFPPGRAPVVLTLVEPAISPEDLAFVFAWQRHLAQRGVALAAPILRRDRAAWGFLAGKPALLTPFLRGSLSSEPTPDQAGQVGALLADMHRASDDFAPRRSNPMAMPAMADVIGALDPAAIDAAVPGLAVELAAGFREALRNWPDGLPEGAVHCDLFPDTVLFAGERLSGAIDFYFSCTAPLAYDLAMTHAAWCFTHGTSRFRDDVSRALVTAYEAGRSLSDRERTALPQLARAACLRILATRLRDWIVPQEGPNVAAKHPAEFAERLRFYSSEAGVKAFAR